MLPVKDPQDMETLFHAYKQDVFRYVMSLLQDYHAAEDVTQEVFLAVYRHLSQYRGDASLRTWIFAVAKNAVTKYKRAHGREEYLADAPLDPAACVPRDGDFYETVALLDPLSRDVVVLRIVGRLRYREIADLLNQTEAAVKKRYARAIRWFREHLEEGGLG